MENIAIQDNWYIKPLELPNVEKFVSDINNISFATTGFVHAWESNLFFDEACQLIINAIKGRSTPEKYGKCWLSVR